MKFATKIALAAAGVFFLFSLFFSGWMLSRSRQSILEQIQEGEEQQLARRQNQLERAADSIQESASQVLLRQLFRDNFDRTSALYLGEQELYNMTGYEFDWESYKRKMAQGEIGSLEIGGRVFEQEEGGTNLLVFVTKFQLSAERCTVVHYRDVTEVYARMRRVMAQGLGAAVLLGLVFVLLLQLVIHGLWRPFRRMQEAANQIAGGNYGVRTGMKRRDEIGQVAESFDQMAEKVEAHVQELSEMNQRQRQLLGSLAHELKTPMTAILGYAQTLQRVKLPQEKQEKALSYIESECRRLSGLSAKMLELTGLYQEEGRLELREISLAGLFDRAQEVARYRLKQKDIRLEREISCPRETLWGDEDLLMSFLLNLIDNGCKATEPGGRLVLTADRRGIGLRDFGCGIPQEEISRVTEAFYMVDKSRSRKAGGAGLGLALCRQIAELHGARLQIESCPGEGTLVLMCWPE